MGVSIDMKGSYDEFTLAVIEWMEEHGGVEALALGYANIRWVGKGSARITYPFIHNGVHYVVKIPRSKRYMDYANYDEDSNSSYADGIYQSDSEIEVWERSSDEERELLCPIVKYFYYQNLPIIVMPFVDFRSADADEDYICGVGKYGECTKRCCECDDNISFLGYLCKTLKIDFDEFFGRVYDLADRLCLSIVDITDNSGNIGIYDNRVVIMDYGLPNHYYESWY